MRTFNGQSGYNLTNASVNAVTAATQNKIFSSNVSGNPASIANPSTDVYTSGDVNVECGGYYYIYNDANPPPKNSRSSSPARPRRALHRRPGDHHDYQPSLLRLDLRRQPVQRESARRRRPSAARRRHHHGLVRLDEVPELPGRLLERRGISIRIGGRATSLSIRTPSIRNSAIIPIRPRRRCWGTGSGTTGVEIVDQSNLTVNYPLAGPPLSSTIS